MSVGPASPGGDGGGQAATPVPEMTAAVTAQVREILEAAERAAAELQREVEQETLRRSAEVRRSAEEDADRIRQEAEAQAAEYLRTSRESVDAFAREQIQRLTLLSEDLLSRADAVLTGLDEAGAARQALNELVRALTEAAETAARLARGGEE